MISKMNYCELSAERSVVVAYRDMEKVAAIDQYYIKLMKTLRISTLLSEMEKSGQRTFLHQHWKEELDPFLTLWSIRVYVSTELMTPK